MPSSASSGNFSCRNAKLEAMRYLPKTALFILQPTAQNLFAGKVSGSPWTRFPTHTDLSNIKNTVIIYPIRQKGKTIRCPWSVSARIKPVLACLPLDYHSRQSPVPYLWIYIEGGPNEGGTFSGPVSSVGGCDFYDSQLIDIHIRLTSILI